MARVLSVNPIALTLLLAIIKSIKAQGLSQITPNISLDYDDNAKGSALDAFGGQAGALAVRDATITTRFSTVSFSRDPNQPRIAALGFEILADTARGLWWVCPAGMTVAARCSLLNVCYDSSDCSEGCGCSGCSRSSQLTA
jgi:hypothetical protein